jgi:hypothetical protein
VITAVNFMPDRFHPVSIGAMAIDGSGTDVLVLNQNSTESQVVLVKDTSGYHPAFAFPCPGIRYPDDRCPASLEDINNDHNGDFTTVLSSPRCVQISKSLQSGIYHAMGGPPGSDSPDFLQNPCALIGLSEDTIDLKVLGPDDYPIDTFEVQVVAWQQYVQYPNGGTNGNFGALPIGSAFTNLVFGLTDNGDSDGGVLTHPKLPLQLAQGGAPGNWSLQYQYYVLVRMIQRNGSTVISSSPAQLVGFAACNDTLPGYALDFMNSISSDGGSGNNHISVSGGRNVGVISKPPHLDPPGSTVKVPAVGPDNVQHANTHW